MVGQAENNNVPTRNAPNSDQEPQRSRGPDDRPTPPHPDEMNRKTAPGRDSAAPSSPGSRRESHHSDGITDQKSLQRTSATKSAHLGPHQMSDLSPESGRKQTLIMRAAESSGTSVVTCRHRR